MARPCNSKFEKTILMKNLNDNENSLAKWKFKLNHQPIFQYEDSFMRAKEFSKKTDEKNCKPINLNCNQGFMPKGKVGFQCHYEERKRRAELRRKKIIQKLKQNYKIDVEGFNEDVTKEIIMKTEILEREKKKREKANIERTVVMITRLLEEQKYKNRGNKVYHPWRKSLKSFSKTLCKAKENEKSDEKKPETIGINDLEEQTEIFDEKVTFQTITSKKETSKLIECKQSLAEQTVVFDQTKEAEKSMKLLESEKLNDSSEVNIAENSIRKRQGSSCVPVEKSLESTPKCIVFQNYEKGKVYLQELKITNIGLETIHCRYLGIVVHTKGEGRFPIGVAVRDSVKLRPGLSCSTKIRLCSQDDTKELKCSVVYETRRKNIPLQHSWFFVQVTCVPVQAVVKITPLKITFPLLTWCEAKSPDGARLLKKNLKIENSGGKACSCRISKVSLESDKVEEHLEEAEEETLSLKTKSDLTEEINFQNSKSTIREEFSGEDYFHSFEEAVANAKILTNELVENIFSVFRFSLKYYIEIPPFSTILIETRFIPQYIGFHHEMHFVQFENYRNCKEQAVEFVGDIKRIPLRAEPQVIDLKTCVSNSGVYAGTFKVFNESKGSYSVFLKVPSSIKKHAHVHPRTTTILPFNYSDFSVRIYPRVSLARDAPKYYQEESQVLEFPVFIHPANVGDCKRDYIKIYVFALITDYRLELSPSFINFGTVTTIETVRTELELTNHSLVLQEYGFLNLPKGVRVEPNMGFGKILPKESITLYLLYSPGIDLLGYDNTEKNHEFQISVTNIAEYGGFREKLEPEEESEKSFEQIWGEDRGYELTVPKVNSYKDNQSLLLQAEDSEDFDICQEDSSTEGEELHEKIYQKENKIREFLKRDTDKFSEHSFFKRMDLQAHDDQHPKGSEAEIRDENFSEFGGVEVLEESSEVYAKCNLNVVNCRAFIVQPRCQISESVIQLPATPCSSFSLYRFRLNANNKAGDDNCFCDFRNVSKQYKGKPKFQGSFKFHYFCPHIKLEPEGGFIKSGDSIPITVIFRPEFPAEQLRQESRMKKAEKFILENKARKITPTSKSDQGAKQSKASKTKPSELTCESAKEDINVSLFELENYDLFAGERSLQELITPFCVETKLRCVIKTTDCGDQNEKTEIHEIVLVCPAIKPNFIYLGNSQEINFNKVFVGTKSKVHLRIQNISFERITPSITLLNPLGAFYCPAGIRKIKVDPEHIWQQPLIYAPLKNRGIEKQFFEIYCGPTNIFLSVSGEGVHPEYKITPNFAFCLMEVKSGGWEEIKLEIENLSSIKMNIFVRTEFVKEGPDLEKETKFLDETKSGKEKTNGTEEGKDKKKSKNSESGKNIRFWDEIPDAVLSKFKNLIDLKVSELTTKVFNLAGLNDNSEVIVPPSGRLQIKIQVFLSEDQRDKKYVVKYALMLEKMSLLKEIIVMAKFFKEK